MSRQIVLDTETTGLFPEHGHKIIELGCVELIDRELTGNNYHQYINPGRTVDKEAESVHGLSNAFLKDKPFFKDIRQDFLEYLNGAEIIAHNAPFDIKFLKAHGCKVNNVIDTLPIARKLFPRKQNNLSALCKRYNIKADREFHGALLDAELLAYIYIRMTGGQKSLILEEKTNESQKIMRISNNREPLRVIYASKEELKLHKEITAKLG